MWSPHPALPGIVVTGQATFEWLGDQQFLIWRSYYDHPEIPDAIAAGVPRRRRSAASSRDR